MDQDVINLAKAIRQKESGGNFDAIGDNGTSRGAYQWQAATWKGHAKQILGDENAPMTRDNQQAVAYGIMKTWKDQGLNPAQIAAKWNSGSEKGWENKIGTTTINGKPIAYNVPQYVKDVTDTYHKFKLETQPTVQPELGTQQPEQKGILSDMATSAKETLIDPFTSRFSNIDYSNQNIASNALQTVGAVAGGAVDVLGKGLISAAKLITPKPVEQAVGDTVGAIGQGVSSAIPEETKQAFASWAQQHPEAAANLGAFIDIASIVPVAKSASVVKGALKTEAGVLAKAEQAVQRIAQPSKPELFNSAQAIRALETIPTEKIKTYSQLREALQAQNTTDLAKVTSEISKDTTKYKLRDFEINREGMKFNPVKDALVGLRELAEKTTDTNLMSKVRQFEIKVNTGDMIQNDVNELAKLVGSKMNAFKQNGELLKRTNAIKAENTRASLKEIARTDMSPDVAALDKATSDRINFTTRMDNIANAVQREINRSPNLNILQKALNVTYDVSDFFMGRVISNVVRKLKQSNRLSAVEVEKELAKNLALVREINKTKDINRIRELLKAAGLFTTSQVVNQVNQPVQPQQ